MDRNERLRFNSLQTGKFMERYWYPDFPYAHWRVSIPFKRESSWKAIYKGDAKTSVT